MLDFQPLKNLKAHFQNKILNFENHNADMQYTQETLDSNSGSINGELIQQSVMHIHATYLRAAISVCGSKSHKFRSALNTHEKELGGKYAVSAKENWFSISTRLL